MARAELAHIRLFVFGLGYSARVIAERVRTGGGSAVGTTRAGRESTIPFADAATITAALARATHVLIGIPPDEADRDPVLAAYAPVIDRARCWLGYLSSTGVYGDTGGAWVDEGAPIGGGRRGGRAAADAAWLARGAHVFRLPGIYGVGRSPFERLRAGNAYRVDAPGHPFSRIHVDDLATGVIAGFAAPPGAYNLADDVPAPQGEVMSYAAGLIGLPPPPLVTPDSLPPQARGFYVESRRVANGKSKRVLGWAPRYADYRFGLRAVSATTSPAIASTDPATASRDQR